MDAIASALQSRPYRTIVYSVLGLYAAVLITDAAQIIVAEEWFDRAEHYLVYALCADIILRFVFINQFSLRSGWFWFDAATTFLAFVPGFEPCRAVRLFRLLGKYEYFRDSIEDIVAAIRLTAPLLGICGLIIFTQALIGYYAFHEAMPELFGTLGTSLITSITFGLVGEGIDFNTMFAVSPGPALIYMLTTLFLFVIVIALIVAEVLKASKLNDVDPQQIEAVALRVIESLDIKGDEDKAILVTMISRKVAVNMKRLKPNRKLL